MSANHEEPVNDPSNYADQSLLQRVHLLETLEAFAQAYSEDYAEGLVDCCRAGRGVDDLLGTIETDVAFQAKRLRTLVLSETHAGVKELLSFEYMISSNVKRCKLLLETVPKFLIDLAVELGDYEEGDLQRQEHDIGLGYTQNFTVKSNNASFEREFSLDFYVGNDVIEITDEVLADVYEEDSTADLAASASEVDDLLGSIFSGEEAAELNATAKAALYDRDAVVALGQLLRQMPGIRAASDASQYEMAERVVVQMFTDTD